MDDEIKAVAEAINSLKDTKTGNALDEALSILPRTLNVLLAPFRKFLLISEENFRMTSQSLCEKLEKVPENKLIAAEPYIMVPALQAISYCLDSVELRNMYANLLAKAMNSDTSDSVHPAFVETIKQMSPIDARLLKDLSVCEFPSFINIQIVEANRAGTETIFKYLTSFSDNPNSAETISISISNLQRIGLVEVTTFEWHTDENTYTDLIQHPRFLLFKSYPLKEGQTIKPQKGSICITPFGESFIHICL